MNQVALITGASRGIGRGIAIELARLGWDLVINYVTNQNAAEETISQCMAASRQNGNNVRIQTCQANIGIASERQKLIDFTRTSFDRLDLLVNNAGVAPETRQDILQATEESFDRVINTNVKGPYFLTQLAANWMIEQCRNSPTGIPRFSAIVFISSVSAYTASVNRGDYCISKAALSMATPLYAARLAEFGIRVYEIRPGIIATEMTEPVKEKYDKLIQAGLSPIKRWGTSEDVAKAVSAIAQNLLPFSTGEIINVDGGFHMRTL